MLKKKTSKCWKTELFYLDRCVICLDSWWRHLFTSSQVDVWGILRDLNCEGVQLLNPFISLRTLLKPPKDIEKICPCFSSQRARSKEQGLSIICLPSSMQFPDLVDVTYIFYMACVFACATTSLTSSAIRIRFVLLFGLHGLSSSAEKLFVGMSCPKTWQKRRALCSRASNTWQKLLRSLETSGNWRVITDCHCCCRKLSVIHCFQNRLPDVSTLPNQGNDAPFGGGVVNPSGYFQRTRR